MCSSAEKLDRTVKETEFAKVSKVRTQLLHNRPSPSSALARFGITYSHAVVLGKANEAKQKQNDGGDDGGDSDSSGVLKRIKLPAWVSHCRRCHCCFSFATAFVDVSEGSEGVKNKKQKKT